MVGITQEAAMSSTIGTFENNTTRRCKDFKDTIRVVIFEIHNVTNAESTGSAVTERHLGRVCEVGAEIGKGDAMVSRLGSC